MPLMLQWKQFRYSIDSGSYQPYFVGDQPVPLSTPFFLGVLNCVMSLSPRAFRDPTYLKDHPGTQIATSDTGIAASLHVCSINSTELTMSTINIPQVFKDCGRTSGVSHSDFRWMWWNWIAYCVAGTLRKNPVENIFDYFCFHCQAGRLDRVDNTAYMDVSCIFLYSETPPSLVTGNRAICIHLSDTVISVGTFCCCCCCFYQELDLCVSLACWPLLAIHFEVFRLWQKCLLHVLKSAWASFPFPGLLYIREKKWTPSLTHHRLAAAQIAAFCVVYIFMGEPG